MILKQQTKQNNKKLKSYQAIETFYPGFCDLYKEEIFFNNTDISIFEEKKNVMTNVFPHRYDLHKKRKKTMLLLNNPVFKKYNQI